MALKGLVVGAGLRGKQWVDVLNRAEGWECAGVLDPDPIALEAVHQKVPWVVKERPSIEVSKIDAAIIATPPASHLSDTLWALETGLNVLVEKPMATSAIEAREMVRSADEAGLALMVAQNYRHMRAHRTARRVIGSGRLGAVRSVTSSYYRTPHEMAPSLRAAQHSILWGMVVHHLDALRYVMGDEFSEVCAVEDPSASGSGPVAPSMRALIDTKGGVRITYSATYESSGHGYFGGGQEFYQRFVGEESTLHMFHRWLFVCEGSKPPLPVWRGRRRQTEEEVMLAELARSIRDGATPSSSGRDNISTMAALDACIQSSRERRWVSVEELTGAS